MKGLKKRQWLCKLGGHNFIEKFRLGYSHPSLWINLDNSFKLCAELSCVVISKCEFCNKLNYKEESLQKGSLDNWDNYKGIPKKILKELQKEKLL